MRKAQRAVQKLARKAYDLKRQQQDEKVAALVNAEPGSTKEKILQRVERAEHTKAMFLRLPSIKPKPSGGISLVKVPTDLPNDPKAAKEWRTVTDSTEVEKLIMERQKVHFGQATPTPFANEPLKSTFNWTGTSPEVDVVLNGDYTPSLHVDPQSNRILQSCTRKMPPISSVISLAEMKQKYRTWYETTSTSPSGRHLGHKHALLKPDGLDRKSAEYAELDAARSEIWRTHHLMLNYGLKYGYCFNRWKKVVTTLIEKEPGDPRIHRLRVIHLYEDCYNLLLGLMYRKSLYAAEDQDVLHEGNYGSRPCRSSLDPIGIEVLQTEYSHLTRLAHLKFSNDADSCYDRIIVNLASVISLCHGVPPEVASIQGQMLEHAKYYIKTGLGISDKSYSHSDDARIDGTGQGSGGSPTVWGFNSSIYFHLQSKLSNGATYHSANGQTSSKIHMTGFVDDNNLQTNEDAFHHEPDTSGLVSRMNLDGQVWHDTLWSSGGALSLGKCQYHLMHWLFSASGAPVLHGGKFGDPICIRNADGTEATIKQLPVGQSYKTLGAHVEPMQHQKTHYNTLLAKSKLHARLLASSSCQAPHTWIYYYSVFLRSIGYSLPVSHLSSDQLNKLQQPIITVVLSKMGYCSNTSRILTFLCSFYGGLDFRGLRLEQGIGQLTFLIRHLRTPGQVHDLLEIALSWFQFCAGVGYPILLYPEKSISHLEGHWLVSIRQFLASIEGSLELTSTHIPALQRSGDAFLMEKACSSRLFSPADLRKLNYCRLYLNVTTLSDVTNATGNRFAPGIFAGTKSVQQNSSKGPAAKQDRPSNPTWAIWRRLLRLYGDINSLFLPLAAWHVSGPNLHRDWPTLYSREYNQIYRRSHQHYDAFKPVRHAVFSFTPHDCHVDVPLDSLPADATEVSDGWRVIHPSSAFYPHETITFSHTFRDYVDLLPDYDAMLI